MDPRMDHSSSSSSSNTTRPSEIRKLNDSLFELYKPPGPASMQILFFHGFQRGDDKDAHLSTWQSGDGSCLWPQTWLVEEYPDAHIISVFYPGLKKNQEYGDMDMFKIGENLMADVLLEDIGQDARSSIVLVGHSFGGIVIKQLCLEAKRKASRSEGHSNFLAKLKGIFFYATPHRGVALEKLAAQFVTQEALMEFVETLSTSTARLNAEFDHLVEDNWGAWLIAGVGECCPIKWGEDGASVVVPEASARYGGDFRTPPGTDHFSICKPQERISASFKDLTKFLQRISTIPRKPGNLQHVHNEIVGHEDMLKEVKGKLQKATRLGLGGMGGVGKSTLARALFNDLIQGPTYEYTCFIKDVKNIEEDLSKDKVQKKVLEDMHHHGKKIAGENLTFLNRKRLLLVLDDVASERDLAIVSFLQDNIEVHEDSRFIATSRDSELLKIFDEVYTVPFLREESSKELFLTYAFKKHAPGPASFAESVDKIVRRCGGLPLTLEVIGKYLYHKPKVIWEQALSALVEADSVCGFHEKLWAKLKLSYDGLQKNEKDMFLDSATIFYGRGLQRTKEIFWSIGIKGFHIVWQHLLDLSLVWEVNSVGGVNIGMHEQLLSLGRKIASSPQENGRRVWEDDKALELLSTENYNEDDVKDIVALTWYGPPKMKLIRPQGGSLCKTEKLRYQQLFDDEPYTIRLRGGSLCKMEKLRYLELIGNEPHPVEIDRSDSAALPSGLVSLLLSRVKFSDVPFNPRNQKPTTVLSLSNRDRVCTMPAPLGNLAALERVEMWSCDSLLGLHSGAFGCLPRLKRLSIWYCADLYELPWTLGNSVESLEIGSCRNLSALPDALVLRLKKMTIFNCHRLLKLPEALGNSQALEHLEINDCKGLSMLPDIKPGCLQKLKKLAIMECDRLHHLPGTFLELQGLEHLRLFNVSFSTIPDFKKLRSLKTLELSFRGGATLPILPQCLGEAINDSNSAIYGGLDKAHVFNVVEGQFLYRGKSRKRRYEF